MNEPDLSRYRKAMQLRDQCRKAAMEHHKRVGLQPSVMYAYATYDAIVEIIREDERAKKLHCGHWQEGDGACCACGLRNWCPDEGETPASLLWRHDNYVCPGSGPETKKDEDERR